jgi:sulfate permease, SulP family
VSRLLPAWARGYSPAWLRADVVAGVVIWSVVTPQAVAYAQIAGLPPAAGLMAAPGALIGYALLGSSRQLVVGATTSTAAVSAAAIATLAHGDTARFAALSALLALVTGAVMALAGALHLGAVADMISKPVMTGFLFGLGLTIMLGQVPKALGVPAGDGSFFGQLGDLLGHLDDIDTPTFAVAALSVAALLVGRRVLPSALPTLVVLVGSIAVSAALGLEHHGIAVVGHLPDALPQLGLPDVRASDVADLVAPACGVLLLSAEGLGVARQLAVRHGYRVDTNRDLLGMGASNALSGLSTGFVQAGGASQTAAAEGAGGRTQLASLVAAGLVLLTGAFLAPLFEQLPEATLAAIVLVAVAKFLDVAELRRFARVRRSALVLSVTAIAGVLVLGILPGLVVTAGLSLLWVIQRLSRPSVGELGRDPAGEAWGRLDRHPGWTVPDGALVVRNEAPVFYPNADGVREAVLGLVHAAPDRPGLVVLDLSTTSDLDLQGADSLGELAAALHGEGIALALADVRVPVAEVLDRAGVADHVMLAPSIDAALARSPGTGVLPSPAGR